MDADEPASAEEIETLLTEMVANGWPPALAKATIDEFTYAIGLTTGLVIVFDSATDLGNGFVRLNGVESNVRPPKNVFLDLPFSFERGIEVRLSEVAWVSDAPWGS